MPWLSCFGNHDGLVLGTAIPTAGYEEVLSGTRKPVDWPEGVDPLSYEAEFTSAPELLLAGPARGGVQRPRPPQRGPARFRGRPPAGGGTIQPATVSSRGT